MSQRDHKLGWFNYYFPQPVASMAHGRLMAKFASFDEVTQWVDGFSEHGEDGELLLRIWISREDEAEEPSRRIARIWLSQREMERTSTHAAQELKIAQTSAYAAKKSALWTMVAALAAAAGTFVTAIVAIYGLVQYPRPIENKFLRVDEFDTVNIDSIDTPLRLRLSRKIGSVQYFNYPVE